MTSEDRTERNKATIATGREADDGTAARASLLAELAVTRRLLAGMASAAYLLALHADLKSEDVDRILDPLRRDSRLQTEAAEAAIAYVIVELAKAKS